MNDVFAPKKAPSVAALDKLTSFTPDGLKQDLQVLRYMWFGKAKGDDHAQRLDNFYKHQAGACEAWGGRGSSLVSRRGPQ